MKKLVLSSALVFLLFAAKAQNNVGIGTDNPQSKLDVKGGITIGNTYSGINAAPANGAIIEGDVGIGTNSPSNKAALDVSSTTKGIFMPRLTTAQAAALGAGLNTSHKGLLIFNTDTNRSEFWDGTQWRPVGEGAGGPPTGTAGGDLSGTYPNPTVGNNAINSAKILDLSITGSDIQGNTIDLTTKVNNVLPVANGGTGVNTVTGIMLGNGGSPVSGITAASASHYLRRNSANTAYEFGQISYAHISGTPTSLPPSGTATGDLTGSYPNPAIAANAVSNAKFRQSASTSVVGNPTATNPANVQDIQATADGQVLRRAGGALGFGTIDGSAFGSQSANTFFAAPNGSAGNPTFRTIQAGDIPDISASYIRNQTGQQAGANFNIAGSGVVGGTMTAATYLFPAPTGDPSPVITARVVPAGQGAANERTELILFHSNDPANSSGDDLITLRAPSLRFQTYNDATVGDINNAAGSNDRMFIRYDGNVGIGTSAPGALLDLGGAPAISLRTPSFAISGNNSNISDRPYFRGTNTHLVIAGATGTSSTMYYSYPGDLAGGVTTSTRIQETVFISATGSGGNGNVGIGASSAGAKLHVAGNSNITGSETVGGGLLVGGTAYSAYGASARIYANNDNAAGGGIMVADDGGFFDYNDAFITFNGSTGLKIAGSSGGASSNGILRINGLAGNGNKVVFADNNGTLTATPNAMWSMSANFAHSPDDWCAGCNTTGQLGDGDDLNAVVTMPFSVNINGTNYNTITVSHNGWVAFGSQVVSGFSNTTLPTSTFTEPVIFPYWDDLQDYGSGEFVRWGCVGSSPNQCMMIQYNQRIRSDGNTDNRVNFMVMIHEGSSLINVKYFNAMAPGYNGQSATIGFQLQGGASAKAYPIVCNGKVLDDNRDDSEGWSVSPVR